MADPKKSIIRNYVAKKLYEKGGTIANRKSVDFSTAAMVERLTEFGIDPRLIRTESELIGALNIVKQMQDKAFDKQFGGMLKGSKFDKRAEVFDLEGRKIPDPERNIMGGQAFETEEEIAKRITRDNKKSVQNLKMQKMLDEAIEDASPGFANDTKYDAELVAENLAGRMGKVYDDLSTKERLDLYDQAYTGLSKQRFKNMPEPEDKADGGRIGYRIGGGPIKSFFEFLNKKNPIQAYRDYLKSIKDKTLKANETGKFTDLPIAEVGIPTATGVFINRAVKKRLEAENEKLKEKEPEKKASGGRIGLKMGRRAFLKALGAGLAGTAAVKSGIVSLGGKTAGKEAVKQVIKTPSVAGKPEWFDTLINKVIKEGDDVTKNFATKEREIVHVKKIDEDNTVRVTQDLDEGAITVEYESPDNVFGDTVQLKYKKPLPDEGNPRPSAEFEVAESGPVGRQTSPDDYDIEIDEVGGNNIKDLSSDVSKLKEYATGKKPTIREMIQNKKRKDKAAKISEDPEARMDDVIRRQGEMLDDQDFASGGLAAMLGE